MFFDFGHQRGQSKAADTRPAAHAITAWFDHYVKGDRASPGERRRRRSPRPARRTRPRAGPFDAPTWDTHPSRARSGGRSAAAPDHPVDRRRPQVSQAVDPITGPGACARRPRTTSPAPPPTGWTRPPARATRCSALAAGRQREARCHRHRGAGHPVAARLWDVAPDGQQSLVARGVYRPIGDAASRPSSFTPTAGASPPATSPSSSSSARTPPYARASNGAFTIDAQRRRAAPARANEPGAAPASRSPRRYRCPGADGWRPRSRRCACACGRAPRRKLRRAPRVLDASAAVRVRGQGLAGVRARRLPVLGQAAGQAPRDHEARLLGHDHASRHPACPSARKTAASPSAAPGRAHGRGSLERLKRCCSRRLYVITYTAAHGDGDRTRPLGARVRRCARRWPSRCATSPSAPASAHRCSRRSSEGRRAPRCDRRRASPPAWSCGSPSCCASTRAARSRSCARASAAGARRHQRPPLRAARPRRCPA